MTNGSGSGLKDEFRPISEAVDDVKGQRNYAIFLLPLFGLSSAFSLFREKTQEILPVKK